MPAEVLLVNDGQPLANLNKYLDWPYVSLYTPPWKLGISSAFNTGIALAGTELVFMLGSDDTLEPTCLEECIDLWIKTNQADGYYSVPIRYMDTGEIQALPCNAAMVTKGFWEYTGGFPVETAVGAGDHIFLSICLANKLPVYLVSEHQPIEHPLYNVRRHPDMHGAGLLGRYGASIAEIRTYLTENWQPPTWRF